MRPFSIWRRDDGATLLEFAFTLPLLAVILYGIWDFAGALTLKQKLEQVVYETARLAASQSTDDLSSTAGTTGSVAGLRDTVAHNLQGAGVNDCGLLGAAPTSPSSPTAIWVYNASGGGCPAPLVLTIKRQGIETVGGVWVFVSVVSVQYPFQYHLNSVLQFLAPGGTLPASTNITATAAMKNLI